jgi:predicted MFS family arabinose efflux permease
VATSLEAEPSSFANTVEPQHAVSKIGPASRVFAVFLCGSLAFLELYSTQPLLPLLAHFFHASEASAGLTISASTLGVAISAALLAVFGERLDRKKTIIGAMWALATAAALTATASNLPALAFWRFLQGLLTPGVFIITIAYITEEWPPHLVPRVMSVYVAGTVFGGFVGRVSGGVLAAHFGFRSMFVVLGVAGALGALVAQMILKPSVTKVKSSSTESPWAPLLRNLRNGRLLATFGIGFCMMFALVSVFSYITFYLAAPPFLLSTTALSSLFSVYLVGLAATLLAGTLLVRFGLRHGMLTAVSLAGIGVGLTLVPSLILVAVGLALASSGVFIAQTCANSFLRDAAPAGSRVSAAGLYICCYYIGGTVGGILPGLLWKFAGWPGCTVLIGVFLTAAAFLTFFGWRPKSKVPDPIPL